ncbi:hypothetical protein AB3S75_045958 [Citrus x aurantiifolia]
MVLCLLQEIGLADDNIVDEQDISAPVLPRTRLHQISARHSWSHRRIYHKQYFSQTPVPQFLVLGNVVDQQ